MCLIVTEGTISGLNLLFLRVVAHLSCGFAPDKSNVEFLASQGVYSVLYVMKSEVIREAQWGSNWLLSHSQTLTYAENVSHETLTFLYNFEGRQSLILVKTAKLFFSLKFNHVCYNDSEVKPERSALVIKNSFMFCHIRSPHYY